MDEAKISGEVGLSIGLAPDLATAENLLRTPPPTISVAEAEAVARQQYGMDVIAKPLSGERDRNFLIEDRAGWSAILKFYNTLDDTESRALQHAVLHHLHTSDPTCPVPTIYPTKMGTEEAEFIHAGQRIAVAMISRLTGENPAAEDRTPQLRADVGRVIGQLSRGLAGFDHPCARRAILWDMMLVAELRHLCAFIENPERRDRMMDWLAHFASETRPEARRLPHQVIHNDLSLSNMMVDPHRRHQVVGVIDFGDVVHAPRVNEFAIAASYFITASGDPIAEIAEIFNGIGSAPTLEPQEIALVPELIKARLATRILLSGWRARLFPSNQAYILRSNRSAWELWDRLATEVSANDAKRLIRLVKGDRHDR